MALPVSLWYSSLQKSDEPKLPNRDPHQSGLEEAACDDHPNERLPPTILVIVDEPASIVDASLRLSIIKL